MPKVISFSLEPHCSICGAVINVFNAYTKRGRVRAHLLLRRVLLVSPHLTGADVITPGVRGHLGLRVSHSIVVTMWWPRALVAFYFAPFYLMCGGDGGGCVFCVLCVCVCAAPERNTMAHTYKRVAQYGMDWVVVSLNLSLHKPFYLRAGMLARTGVPFNLHDWNKCWCF